MLAGRDLFSFSRGRAFRIFSSFSHWALGRARFVRGLPARPRRCGHHHHTYSRRLLEGRRPLSKRNPAARPRAADSLGFGAFPLSGRSRCRRWYAPPLPPSVPPSGLTPPPPSSRPKQQGTGRDFLFESLALTRVLASSCNLAPPPLRLPAKGVFFLAVIWLLWTILLPWGDLNS